GDGRSWRWAKRLAAAPDGCCCRGRRATASSSTSGRRTIATHWRVARRFSRSICTSTPITWTSAPRRRVTSTHSWTSFAGTTWSDYLFKRQMVEGWRAIQGSELHPEGDHHGCCSRACDWRHGDDWQSRQRPGGRLEEGR